MFENRKEHVEIDPDWLDDANIDISFTIEIDSYTFDKVLNNLNDLSDESKTEVIIHLGCMVAKAIQGVGH